MKNLFTNTTVVLIALILLTIIGCKSEDDTTISYPSSGFYGNNVLALPDSSALSSENYSFAADLGDQATLRIVMTNFSNTPKTVWFYTNANGWLASSYVGNQQQFESITEGSLDMQTVFAYGPGTCQVDFYENGNTITHTKYFTW